MGNYRASCFSGRTIFVGRGFSMLVLRVDGIGRAGTFLLSAFGYIGLYSSKMETTMGTVLVYGGCIGIMEGNGEFCIIGGNMGLHRILTGLAEGHA